MESISDINIQLSMGKLPDCLNFAPKPKGDIDWSKVAYNTYYRSKEFQLSKISNPSAFMNLPGANEILESMASNACSPLEAMELRQEYTSNIEVLDD
jgi:hypothetical protein